MKIIFIGILSGLMLIGCATSSQYKAKISSLVGQSEDALVAQWGKPTARYNDENGDEVIAYIRTRDVIVPGTSVLTGSTSISHSTNFGQVNSSDTPSSVIQLNCMTKFTIKNGAVNSFTFKGNDCKTRNW